MPFDLGAIARGRHVTHPCNIENSDQLTTVQNRLKVKQKWFSYRVTFDIIAFRVAGTSLK
jgi:hypothetical protein